MLKLRKYKGIQTVNLISNMRGQILINSACIRQYLHFATFFMWSRKPIFKSSDYFFKIHSTTVFSNDTCFRVQTRKTDVIVRSWWLRQTFSIKTASLWTLKNVIELHVPSLGRSFTFGCFCKYFLLWNNVQTRYAKGLGMETMKK